MLKKRLITAGILLPLVILGVLYLPVDYFYLVSAGIFLLAVWEWTRLAGFQSLLGRISGSLDILILSALFLVFLPRFLNVALILFMPIVIWSLAFCMVLAYPKGAWVYTSRVMGVLWGACILSMAYLTLCYLKTVSAQYVLYVLALVWSADTGAFFVGRRFGRHKLAPEVSPGKTWEGVLGALVLGYLVSAGVYFMLDFPKQFSFLFWSLLSIITVLMSIVGDLFESLFKRLRNLKDSGTLLPGHGGVLDRLDSLIAAVPVFTVLMIVMNFIFLREI